MPLIKTGTAAAFRACFSRPLPAIWSEDYGASMKNSSRKILAAAAFAGLLNGAAIHQSRGGPATNGMPGKVAPVKKVPKVHDCAGVNDCKGIGGCKTDAHECKFKNDCKGKGGCEISTKDIKDWEKKQKEKEKNDKKPVPS
jgi:hypothetical protein